MMYILDTYVFTAMGHFFPSRFPTIWAKVEELVQSKVLRSVKEVEESKIVAEIFKKEQYRGLVRRDKMLKGLPVADPFIIAAAKAHKNGCVITQESLKPGGARIPTICADMKIACIDLEQFLEQQNLKY